jgi:hypothetical protein
MRAVLVSGACGRKTLFLYLSRNTSMVPVRCYGFSLFISEGALLRFFFVNIQRNIVQSKSERM